MWQEGTGEKDFPAGADLDFLKGGGHSQIYHHVDVGLQLGYALLGASHANTA